MADPATAPSTNGANGSHADSIMTDSTPAAATDSQPSATVIAPDQSPTTQPTQATTNIDTTSSSTSNDGATSSVSETQQAASVPVDTTAAATSASAAVTDSTSAATSSKPHATDAASAPTSAPVEPVPAPATSSSSSSSSKSSKSFKLPSDSSIRSSLHSLLLASDLTTLTPKIVRVRLLTELGLEGDAAESALKKKLKSMLAEEIEKVTKGKEGGEAASKPKSGKKSRKAEKSEDDEFEPDKKKHKGASGSAKKKTKKSAAASSDDADEMDTEEPEPEPEAEPEPEPEMTQEEKDAAYAAELAAQFGRPRRAAAQPVKVKPPRAKKPADPNAPKRPAPSVTISPALAAFFNNESGLMNRGEVVKQMWVYIKEHSLQDPNNGRRIILDDKMKTIFGGNRKTMDMMQMSKLLQPHLKRTDQLTG